MTDDLFEPSGHVNNPFVNSDENAETEELSKSMSEVYYDDEAEEMKLEETDDTEELEETEDVDIEELRSIYERYSGAGWEEPANKARGALVAALREKNRDLQTEIDDTPNYSDTDELESEKRETEAEIEELAR